jgi:hypothetical protein
MARSFIVSEKPGATDFVTAVNALLAVLTNPTIRGVRFNVDERQRRDQRVYSTVISYDTGGAALGTPFLIRVDEAGSLADLKTALDAAIAANPTYFWASTNYAYLYTGSRNPRYIGITPYTTTGTASANWVPY